MTSNDEIVRCPACGGRDVRSSATKGLLDSFLRAFHKRPFRCRGCQHRFYRHVPERDTSAEVTPRVDTPHRS